MSTQARSKTGVLGLNKPLTGTIAIFAGEVLDIYLTPACQEGMTEVERTGVKHIYHDK